MSTLVRYSSKQFVTNNHLFNFWQQDVSHFTPQSLFKLTCDDKICCLELYCLTPLALPRTRCVVWHTSWILRTLYRKHYPRTRCMKNTSSPLSLTLQIELFFNFLPLLRLRRQYACRLFAMTPRLYRAAVHYPGGSFWTTCSLPFFHSLVTLVAFHRTTWTYSTASIYPSCFSFPALLTNLLFSQIEYSENSSGRTTHTLLVKTGLWHSLLFVIMRFFMGGLLGTQLHISMRK